MNSSFDISVLKKSRENNKRPGQPELTRQAKGKDFLGMLNKDIHFLSNPFPDKIKEFFYLELSSLLEAGLDIKTSLEVIKEEQEKEKYKTVFADMLSMIVNGNTLSFALKSLKHFTAYEFYSVQIGEETGELGKILKELSLYFKSKIKQRKQLIGALTYPLIVLTVACGAIFFMMNYVVPMFADIFKRFGNQLPLVTRMTLRISQFFRANFLYFSGAITLTVMLVFINRKKQWFLKIYAYNIIRLPVIGALVKKIYLLRFAGTMSLLINSRIPLLQSIDLVKQMLHFFPLVNALEDTEAAVLNGQSLHEAMAKHSIFPSKMITMVKVGEEVNQLEVFFGKIAEYYSIELEHQTTMIGKFIEPAIILLLGLVVGLILIAMYLPLFSMGNMIN